MKLKLVLLALAGCALAGQASAQTCATGFRVTNSTTANNLATLVSGNTVCARRGSGERWQEYHNPSGILTDYKQGPTDPVDPSEDVGSWSVAGTGASTNITYNYGSGGTYTFAVYRVGSGAATTYNFCGPSSVIGATFRTGQGACP